MNTTYLTGHFLIAMPAMVDPYFSKTLTYICEHNEQGALGVVVNRPIDMNVEALFEQVGLTLTASAHKTDQLYFGGPVQTDRGFVLHRPLGSWNSSLNVSAEVGLTTSKDILDSIAAGEGPEDFLITLGYAGWGAGQLERELLDNAWLSVPADPEILFATSAENRLNAAMAKLGIDYASLSEEAGHA